MQEYIESLTSVCSCNVKIRVVKLAPNKYYVGERDCVIHVRSVPFHRMVWLLMTSRVMSSHVLVRVGGGWDTLGSFLSKLDPCRRKVRACNRACCAAHIPQRKDEMIQLLSSVATGGAAKSPGCARLPGPSSLIFMTGIEATKNPSLVCHVSIMMRRSLFPAPALPPLALSPFSSPFLYFEKANDLEGEFRRSSAAAKRAFRVK